MEQAFLAPLHQGPSRAGRMMRCPNQSICRTVLFMCGAVTDVPVPDNGAVTTVTTLWFNPAWQMSSAQPLSHSCLPCTTRAAVKGFLLSLFSLSALLSVLCKKETANTTDKQIRRSKQHEAISLTKRKDRWSCVNVSCFLHNMKYWDERKAFYELLQSSKRALAKLMWSGAGCWWILFSERMRQKLIPCLFSRAESVGRAQQHLIHPKLLFLTLFRELFNSTEVEEYKKGKAERQQVQYLC